MRSIRIFHSGTYHEGEQAWLSPEAVRHVATVLRLRPGSQLQLFDGQGSQCEATIISASRKAVAVKLMKPVRVSRESPLAIHLGQAVSKNSRMEWVIQKAVELGVHSITPLYSEYCAVKRDVQRMEKKQQQWQGLIISACEQCGRNQLPVLREPQFLPAFLDQVQDCAQKLILTPDASTRLQQHALTTQPTALIIGPEGGLSNTEINQAANQGFDAISLGPRILRTETAAIAALSLLQGILGDL